MAVRQKDTFRSNGQFRQEEDLSMLHYLIDVVPTSGPYKLWNEYKRVSGTERTVNSLYNRFTYNLGPRLHLANLGIESKLKLYQKYGLKVDRAYLELLKRYADLTIIGSEHIVDYKLKEGVNPKWSVRTENDVVSPPPSPVMLPPPQPPHTPGVQKVDPLAVFFNSIKEVIKQSNRELLGEFTTAVGGIGPNENQPPTNDLQSSMKAFLVSMKTLVAHLHSPELDARIEAAMKKFEDNTVPTSELQTTLEFTLALLGC